MTSHEAYYEQLAAGDFAIGPKGTIVFVVFTDQLRLRRGDLFVALGLGKYLQRLGWGVRLWPGPKWDEPFEGPADAAIIMIESYLPGMLPPHIATIAWVRNWTEKWAALPYLGDFDAIWASSGPSAEALATSWGGDVQVVPIGVDREMFSVSREGKDVEVFSSANFWGDEREIARALATVSRSHQVVWVGGGTTGDIASITFPGAVSYFELPDWYNRSTIVVDDQIPAAKRYGNQNSRLFESIGAGAIPVTNSALGLAELGLGAVPVFGNPAELETIVSNLLHNSVWASELQATLAAVVDERHGFDHRAALIDPVLSRLVAHTRGRTARSHLIVWLTEERARYNELLQQNAAAEVRFAELRSRHEAEPSTSSLFAASARRLLQLPARIGRRLFARGG